MEEQNPEMADWMEISGLMLRDLMPKGAGIEAFGHDLPPAEYAAMVEREADRVDHALTALATAAGEAEVKIIFSQLGRDTVMVLFSRWAHYTEKWQKLLSQQNPQHWFPPERRDWWRAVFLSMTGENWHSTAACRSLWPAVF